jgi:hypothetical protein
MRRGFFTVLMLLSLTLNSMASDQDQKTTGFGNAKDHWTFLVGYGITHKGFGSTKTRVEAADFIVQYGYFLSEEKGGSWYRGRHEVMIEIPFSYTSHPDSAVITGINFLGCWNFTSSREVIPYACAGGGPVYTNLDISGMGSELNGNYQAGLGLHYIIGEGVSIDINYRLHHISNAGTADPNEPLNSSKFLLGVSFLH